MCRIVKPTSQWLLAIRHMMTKLDPAGVQKPTRTEIADRAIDLARYDRHLGGVAPRIAEVFHWPPWATPCQDERSTILPLVEKYKKQAEEELFRHYLYHHALAIRRQRWLRAHPQPQIRGWTRQPLKHAAPVPRKRIFRLPDRDGFPDALSPPLPPMPLEAVGPPPGAWFSGASPPLPTWPRESSAKRPGRREQEGPRFRVWLIDNQIATIGRSIPLLAGGRGYFLPAA